MLKQDKLQHTSNITSYTEGVFIPLDPIDYFNSSGYLKVAQETIEYAKDHPNQVPDEISSRLKLFYSPAFNLG